MARKQKSKPVQTEAQIFSEILKRYCEKHGTKEVATAFGVTVRSVQVWKNDASKMNHISLIGAKQVLSEIENETISYNA